MWSLGGQAVEMGRYVSAGRAGAELRFEKIILAEIS